MPDTLDILRKLALQIRNASSEGENTAERVGRTLVGILNLLSKYSPEELEKIFLRKDRADGTNFLLKFGEFIDSMVAGKGAGIFPDGRMQLSRLEVRDSLTVLELIFNRLSAMESDYSFSESGTIESVSQLEDGTYSLKMKKRWDNDFTALAENDVVYGVVNDLASGGGKYYTSWLRVLHVDISANTINAVMYPDSEVPGGKNYPPEPLMILSHRGNPVDTERQGYWYLSSREHCICMLNGVTKPVLEESNYSVIVGRLKHLSLFDNLPINYLHSYIYVRGLVAQDIHRIDFQGVLPRIANDRGEWNMETATGAEPYQADREAQTETVRVMMYDTVWHYGCKWMCLVSGTTDEPKYGAAGWAMVEGNPDFSIDIESSNGWYFDAERLRPPSPLPVSCTTVTLRRISLTVMWSGRAIRATSPRTTPGRSHTRKPASHCR